MILRPEPLPEHDRPDLVSSRPLTAPGLELEGGRVIVRDARLARVIEGIRRERAKAERASCGSC